MSALLAATSPALQAAVIAGVGLFMLLAGLGKHRLEWRVPRRLPCSLRSRLRRRFPRP